MSGKILLGTLVGLCFVACGRTPGSMPAREKAFERSARLAADSVPLPYLVHPFRWYVQGDRLWLLDNQADHFSHLFSLPELQPLCRFGRQGRGPGEYLSPGMACMQRADETALFESMPNRFCLYRQKGDTVALLQTLQFPVWMKARALPKAYSRLWQTKDTLYIGIAFPPRFPEIDLIDMAVSEIRASLSFPLSGSERAGSYPYLFTAAYCQGKLVLAYQYIDRIEVYDVGRDGFQLDYVIGTGEPQEELSIRDEDDRMIRHYSAVQCDGERIYALYQGYPDGAFSGDGIVSSLEIYRSEDGTGETRVDLGRRIDDVVLDSIRHTLYGYSAVCDSAQFYTFDLSGLR
ncbi:BF3164 family lipoprotein [uncultured Rikenella sp.]|uniref:BF3164 family lipoprotein n=1 Tax=uncultured Rikenella sp. TaxID=368003 RepID=UPI00260A3DE3|nr:BF3164 family lipoprotein [uncultured Rikenella sp.]